VLHQNGAIRLRPRTEQIRAWLDKDHLLLTKVHKLLGREGLVVSYSTSLYRSSEQVVRVWQGVLDHRAAAALLGALGKVSKPTYEVQPTPIASSPARPATPATCRDQQPGNGGRGIAERPWPLPHPTRATLGSMSALAVYTHMWRQFSVFGTRSSPPASRGPLRARRSARKQCHSAFAEPPRTAADLER